MTVRELSELLQALCAVQKDDLDIQMVTYNGENWDRVDIQQIEIGEGYVAFAELDSAER
jgi:SPX domain protein involved in polyphosphate accumulation